MKLNKCALVPIAICVTMAVLFATPYGSKQIVAQDAASKNPVWEYKIVKITKEDLTEDQLNRLGEEGWELRTAVSDRPATTGGQLRIVTYVFSRQRVKS